MFQNYQCDLYENNTMGAVNKCEYLYLDENSQQIHHLLVIVT